MTSEADRPAVTVVVMAYNEAQNLEPAVREIVAVLEDMGGEQEVVVVNDGSDDDTGVIAERLAASLQLVRAVHHPSNLGLGSVYRTGFSEARGEYITFFPADGQFPASSIPEFRQVISTADLVLGYIPDRGLVEARSLAGRTMSALERALYRGLFGRFPRFQGIFMCRSALLKEFELRSSGRGWGILNELIIRTQRGGYRIVNCATPLRPRQAGRSKVQNVRTILSNAWQMIALRRLL